MVQDGSERTLIKAKYGSDIRKAYVSPHELQQVATLENYVRNIFAISDDDLILLKYIDGDGDLVSLTNDADVEVALRNERQLSFHVFTSGEDDRADIARLQTDIGNLKNQLDKISLALDSRVAHFESREQDHTRLSSPLTPGRRQELAESVATIEPSRHEQIDHNGVSHLVSAAESASVIASESAQHTQDDFSQQNLYQQQQQEYAAPPQEQQQHQEFSAPPSNEFQQPPQNDFQHPPQQSDFQQPPPPQQQQFQDYQQQQQQQPPLETVPIDQGSQQQQQFQPPPSNGFGAPPQGFGVPPPSQFSAPPPPQGFGVPPQGPPAFNNGISSPPSVDGRASIPPQHQQFQQGPPQGFTPSLQSQPSAPGTPHHFQQQQQQQQPPLNKASAPSPFPGNQYGPPPPSQFGPPPTGQQFGGPPPTGAPQQFGAPPPSNGQQQFGVPPTFPGQQPPVGAPGAPPTSGQPPLGPPPSGLPIGPPPTFGSGPPPAGGLPNPFARQGQQFPPRPQFGNY